MSTVYHIDAIGNNPERLLLLMARYQFTQADRQKGGRATASKVPPPGYKSWMHFIGQKGNQAGAEKYTNGDIDRYLAGLTQISNYLSDPFPYNSWSSLPDWLPRGRRLRYQQRRIRLFGEGVPV